jgi:hypothetical protein
VTSASIDISDLKALARDLRQLGQTSGRRIVYAMKDASRAVAADAKSQAAWSTRIPGTVQASATQQGLIVKAGGPNAPHAAVYESGGHHPLFGNRGYWYPVPKRPYLASARDANMDKLANALLDAVVQTLRTTGG